MRLCHEIAEATICILPNICACVINACVENAWVEGWAFLKPDRTLNLQYSHDDVQLLNKTKAYAGFFQIESYQLKHKKFSGEWTPPLTRELFERGDAAAVLPYDPEQDVVVLIEQFRIGALRKQASPWLIELVAGIIDENDQSPEQVIHREAKEEVGLYLGQVEPIHQYWVSPGGSSERMYLYCAEVNATLAPAYAGVEHEDEDIRVHVVPADDAFAGLAAGTIDNAITIMALQWLQLNKDRLRESWRQV